jgi:mono/diheme cytochrome c family protein
MKKKFIIYPISAIILVAIFIAASNQDATGWSIPKQYSEMKNTQKSDKKSMAAGKELFGKICASCHGDEGRGDGPKAKKMKQPLVDISTKKYLDTNKDGELYYKAFIGRNNHNYEKRIGDKDDCWKIINYMRSLSH